MSVLVEGISVIVRTEAIAENYPGGIEAFRSDCPNNTFCTDSVLARVGFMAPVDTRHFVSILNSKGLTYRKDGKAVDIVVADQQRGFPVPCEWAMVHHAPVPGAESIQVTACMAFGAEDEPLATPDGWTYEGSLSDEFGHIDSGATAERLVFLRREDGMDVYRDKKTGEEVYVGRTGGAS